MRIVRSRERGFDGALLGAEDVVVVVAGEDDDEDDVAALGSCAVVVGI